MRLRKVAPAIEPDFDRLRADARAARERFLKMHYRAKSGHIGSGLSCLDILVYLYGSWLGRADKFILSKGHGASALYATLAHFGHLSEKQLETYYQDGTLLAAHPVPHAIPVIPAATGSLGHGLPIANGLAFGALKLRRQPDRVVCLLSDGECNEGSIWEAALFAQHHGLKNLVVIVDSNGLQGFGRTEDVIRMEPMQEKWKAFGFETRVVDGHSFEDLHRTLAEIEASASSQRKPVCLIARTTKGKGVSFMENKLEWHYLPMNEEQFQAALAELGSGSDDES